MKLNNISSLTLNYKPLTQVIENNYNFNDFNKILKTDSETVATLESLKQLYLELVTIKSKLNKKLEEHIYENNLLYYNNLVISDCYTFKNSLLSSIYISNLIYNTKSKSMDLDSYNTLLFAMSVSSNFSNTPNISYTYKGTYDLQFKFNTVHLPYTLPYTPMTTEITKTMNFDSSQTQNFTIYTSNRTQPSSSEKSNIFSVYMAEEIINLKQITHIYGQKMF